MEARDIARTNLESVRARILEMMALERSLARFVDSCTATCAGGPAPDCSILKDLGPADARQAGCCR